MNAAYIFGSFAPSGIIASEILCDHPAGRAWTLPADMAGSTVECDTPPAATWEGTVLKDGVPFGTVTISVTGAVTLSTGGQAVAFALGESFRFRGDPDADAALAGLRYTFVGA